MEVCGDRAGVIVFVALMTYQVTYSRLIFVSGLERHLPRIFTHLNPRTRNPVTAVLIQGVLSSLILVGLYSQSSMANVTVFLQGGLSIVWLISGFFFLFRGHRAQEVCGSLCQRDVLAYSRRHGRRVDRPSSVGIAGHLCGIYYSFAKSWIKTCRTDMDDVGRQHRRGHVRCSVWSSTSSAAGRRTRSSKEDALAHLAVLDLKEREA